MPAFALQTKSADFARGERLKNIEGMLVREPNDLLPLIQPRHVDKVEATEPARENEKNNTA